jgi:hypothetical protein
MTNNEQKTINELYQLLSNIQQENKKFREDVKNQVEILSSKIEQKQLPVTLEQDILKVTQHSISEAIKSVLIGYNSPLTKLVSEVINNYSKDLKDIISDSFSQVIKTDEFKQSIIEAFSHKVARTIISNNEGLFDKVSNELKQDSQFKAKITLAVANVVESCLNERKGEIKTWQ